MRRIVVFIGIIAVLALLSCGGGTKIEMPKEGVRLTYAPAVGKTFNYRTMVQKYIQQSEKGSTINQLIKGDVRLDISVIEADEEGNAKMTYLFKDVAVGRFVNNQIESSEDIEEMKDLELMVVIDSAGTRTEDDELEMDEEMQKAAKGISPLEFILDFPMPDENITVGYSWHEEEDTVVEDEDGTITQKVVVDYKILDFVMLNGARTVVCQHTGTYDVTQKGETEYEGKTYDVDMTMNGDIKGKVHFDIDNGCIAEYEYNKMIDVKGTQTELDSGEEQPIVYYNQIMIKSELQRNK